MYRRVPPDDSIDVRWMPAWSSAGRARPHPEPDAAAVADAVVVFGSVVVAELVAAELVAAEWVGSTPAGSV